MSTWCLVCFRSYQLASADCYTAGCTISGVGTTSSCIAPGDLGQNTYSYYALESLLNDGSYDVDRNSESYIDYGDYHQILVLSDGKCFMLQYLIKWLIIYINHRICHWVWYSYFSELFLPYQPESLTGLIYYTQATGKAGSAIDLCMGGISAFSVDQDNWNNDLTTAIWDAGGLAPSADQIAQGKYKFGLQCSC